MDSKETASLTPSETSYPSSGSENLSKNTISTSDSDNVGSVSDDEGYPSGKEEFETASDESSMVETVGEDNFDEPFIDAPSDVEFLPDSEVENDDDDDDDDVEKVNEDVEGEENALENVSEGGFDAHNSEELKFDGEGEVIVDKLDVRLDERVVVSDGEIVDSDYGKLVVDEVEMKGYDYEEMGKIGILSGGNELKLEGDSVVDSSHVDVASYGVAVVGKVEENGDVANETDANEVVEAVVESEQSEVVNHGAVSEADCVVDHIQVDGEIEENGDVADESVANEVVKAVVEPERSEVVNHSIQVDLLTPGIAVVVSEATENNNITSKIGTNGEIGIVDEIEGSDRDENQLHHSNGGIQTSDDEFIVNNNGALQDELVSEEPKRADFNETKTALDPPQQITEVEKEVDSISDGETDGMIFGSSEAARKCIEELEQTSGVDSSEQSQRIIDGQVVTDSEDEEGDDTDDEGKYEKELFDSAALSALLKAATGADSDGGNITIASRDGTRLFTVERPAGPGSSLRALRPAPQLNPFSPTLTNVGRLEESLSEEEKKNLEKIQQIRVKFLRLVHRLGLSPDEPVAAQVLHRLALLGGRKGTELFSLDAAKNMALQLEAEERDNLDFSINFLILGKSGVGKSATINSIFGEEKVRIDAFENGTAFTKEISGFVDGVKVRVFDTPGLKSSVMEQSFNNGVLSSIKKFTNKTPPDVVLYVDRLDAQTRDLNDLPLLKTVTNALGPLIWRSAIVTLTHAACAPPDGPNGTPLSYEMFVTQRSHVVQQSIGHAVGDLRMMSPSLMNPVSLVENRKNGRGEKILPNGQIWRPQLLLLCYSMKILSEASAVSKPQELFDHRKLFGFRAHSPPLPYMLSSMLQCRAHPKLQSDQNVDSVDSDIDLDDLSESDEEREDEYDQLPPFKPLKKAQIGKLTKEQKNAYFEEYDYRVKLLQKKQWREELRRMRDIKKKGKDFVSDYGFADEDVDNGAAAPVAVPLPDMALPPTFDGDTPAYGYRFLEPTSHFLARPVLDSQGWDHDCGYDGVNLEHTLAIANRFPVAYTVQITKDKRDFNISLDSSIAAKHGEDISSMLGFDIQSMGKQLVYIVRGETKIQKLKKNKAAGGLFLTVLGENVVPGVKIEDQITFGKQYVIVGSAGGVRSQNDTAYGANFELQRRESDYPIGQVQSTLSMSIIKWRGDLALGLNSLTQFSLGRNSKVAVRAGINNKLSGQVTIKTISSENLSLALAAVIPAAISIYRKLWPGANENYSIY